MIEYHHPEAKRTLELPVYRCTEEQHYREQAARYESATRFTTEALRMMDKGPEFTAEQAEMCRKDWFKREGRPWDFNQIVGWIRLYGVDRKRRSIFIFCRWTNFKKHGS